MSCKNLHENKDKICSWKNYIIQIFFFWNIFTFFFYYFVFAKGSCSHHWMIFLVRRSNRQKHLRPRAKRYFCMCCRLWMDYWSHLRRLWATFQWLHNIHVRIDTRLSWRGTILGHGRTPQNHTILYCTNSNSTFDEIRNRAHHQIWFEQSESPRICRRTNQPRGVAVVPQGGGRRQVQHLWHLLADRDRRSYHYPSPRSNPNQAWLCLLPLLWSGAWDSGWGGEGDWGGGRGLHRV